MRQKRPTKKLSDVPSINDIDVLRESNRTYSSHLTTGTVGPTRGCRFWSRVPPQSLEPAAPSQPKAEPRHDDHCNNCNGTGYHAKTQVARREHARPFIGRKNERLGYIPAPNHLQPPLTRHCRASGVGSWGHAQTQGQRLVAWFSAVAAHSSWISSSFNDLHRAIPKNMTGCHGFKV